MHTRPIWAGISRSHLIANFKNLQAVAGVETDLLAMVKGNAYGHGATLCASWLAAAGAEWLGVTSVEEGVAVRQVCPTTAGKPRILVMCGLWTGEEEAVLDDALTPAVWDMQHIELLATAAERRKLPPASVPVHLEIDTGMSRQGVAATPEALMPVLDRIRAASALHLEGVFTHFASAEVFDATQNLDQIENFARALEKIIGAGFRPAWVHGGNTATLLGPQMLSPLAALARLHHARLMMRPGIALYGYALPIVDVEGSSRQALPVALEPILHWKTRVVSLREVEAGALVGYNATFTAKRPMRLALLPVGYADGLNRKLSNRGHVLVRGRQAAILGRISMDLTLVDVSAITDVAVGDEVVLIGEQTAPDGSVMRITAADHAAWAETIPYEILCAISARVPRIAAE
ncbi:MAG TPA: alanine racemase [Acidobacteriaceae bacterium]|jgi:alanine racemase|nr:alanine racemase [Acidobacteriaceae bacterium]